MESGDIEKPAAPAPPPATDPLIGTIIGDRYRVVRLLGRGGMAAVYRGEHELLKKPVAIKVILPSLGDDPDMARRFEREATLAAKLDHPNCVAVTDFGRTSSGRFFLVMEYLEGIALADLLFEQRRVSSERALDYTRQILRGLGRAHELGILHRDLKASNIMLIKRPGPGGREVAKIIDFGIARLVGDTATTQGFKTEAGIVFGTADYLAPERLTAAPDIDGRCDLYSVGVMLYEMLCGERPFHAEDPMEIVQRTLKELPMPPRDKAPDAGISPALERVVLRALEKDPRRRYADARAMLEALDGISVVQASSEAQGARAPAAGGADAAGAGGDAPVLSLPFDSAPPSAGGAAPPTTASSARAIAAVRARSEPRPQLPTVARRRISRMAWGWLIAVPVLLTTIAILVATRGGGEHPRVQARPTRSAPDLAGLAARAATGETMAERDAAYQQLVALGYRDRVDFVAKLSRDLLQAPTCEARRERVQALAALNDQAAIPALRKATQAPDNACLISAAEAAIASLSARTPAGRAEGTAKPPARSPRPGGAANKPVKSNADRF
ncbi:MAG: serine/threonine protein kinase [Deltaproteobacteria bacterium]|nr:serine/threonine protein kinase [Deltaproteobacteria bacterium]